MEVSPIKFIRNLWVHLCKVEEAKIVRVKNRSKIGESVFWKPKSLGLKTALESSLYTCAPPVAPLARVVQKDPIADYGVYVGVPASTVAIMIAKDDIAVDTGLFRASQIEPAKGKFPEKFLNELKKRGFSVYRRA